jgi:hypothetical protein
MRLKIEPKFGCDPEITAETQRGISGNRPPSLNDLVNSARRDSEILRETVFSDAHGRQKFFGEDFPGRNVTKQLTFHGSMIIYNFDIICVALAPTKADPPLIIDPNTMLSSPVSFQGLQTVSRWDSELPQFGRGVNEQEFASCDSLHSRRKSSRLLRVKDAFGFLASEA